MCDEPHSTVFCQKSNTQDKLEALTNCLSTANVTNTNPISAHEIKNHQEPEDPYESEEDDETMFIDTISKKLESLNQKQDWA